MTEISKGRICSDCDGTIYGSMYPKGMNTLLFEYLIALKRSGYEVIIFSNDVLTNESRIGFHSQIYARDTNFFEYTGEIDDSYEQIVSHKDYVAGYDAMAVFDDDHASHGTKTDFKLNPSNQGVLDYMKEQLAEFNEKGSIEFDPQKIMDAQLAADASLKNEATALNQEFSSKGAHIVQVLGGTFGNIDSVDEAVADLQDLTRIAKNENFSLNDENVRIFENVSEALRSYPVSVERVVVLGPGPKREP